MILKNISSHLIRLIISGKIVLRNFPTAIQVVIDYSDYFLTLIHNIVKREIMKVIESLCSLVALNAKLIPNRTSTCQSAL